ncbi:hypothetical protein AAH995_28545 [Pseudomonas putida]|uniref:hypothetical protein n=1 Tax=Pseudomonas putida TaxID=303 RepID=UPI0021610233|nr:hypothetical protein [Pseudomonas putida]UVL81137.1 hypothetical protein LOY24_13705 [Pseudomonas putida]
MSYILTYPKKIAPYESSWMMYLKVLLNNDISMDDLQGLIAKPGYLRSRFLWYSSAGIDLEVLAGALNARREYLYSAFIDLLAWWDSGLSTERVRHCGTCLSKRYHCSLFQLPWITHCPVHNERLKGCKACAGLFRSSTISSVHGQCSEGVCHHVQSFYSKDFAACLLSDDELAKFDRWASSLARWLRKARAVNKSERCTSPGERLGLSCGRAFLVYMRFLEGKIGKCPSPFSGPKFEVRRTVLPGTRRFDVAAKGDLDIDLIACVKAIRRQIFKRYIKRHHKCLQKFKRHGVCHSHLLIGRVRCSCSIAYCSWLATALNVFTLRDMFDRKVNPYAAGRPFFNNSDMNSRVFLFEVWGAFFDIWAVCELNDADEHKPDELRIMIGQKRLEFRRDHFSCRTMMINDIPSHYTVDGCFLLERSWVRCQSRGQSSMIVGEFNEQDCWGEANVHRADLFTVINNFACTRSIEYLYV